MHDQLCANFRKMPNHVFKGKTIMLSVVRPKIKTYPGTRECSLQKRKTTSPAGLMGHVLSLPSIIGSVSFVPHFCFGFSPYTVW